MDIGVKKRQFWIFLIINAILMSCVQMFRTVISIDSMEAIAWGELLDFGTNKHPFLSGWVMGGFYNLLGQHNWIAYVLGQACILIGFVFIYKLAKFFLDEEKAMCSSMVMASCYYYTYIAVIDNFNCNFLSMAIWPMIAYYFYKSVKEEKIKDWIIFGIMSALGVLTKYQVIFLYFALFLYLVFCARDQFRKKGMYVSVLTGFLIVLPHIVWLFNTDFFSFLYMADRSEIGVHNTPQFLLPFGKIVFPVKFIMDQVLSVGASFVVYLFLALQAKNISLNREDNKQEKLFILFLAFVPILAQSGMAFVENNRIMGIWGSMMVGFIGMFLFYFFPINFNKDTFKHCLKWAYTLMTMWLIAMVIFLQLQVKRTLSYPHKKIMSDIDKVWVDKTNNADLKYVGGHIDYVFQFRLYNSHHPKVILETFGHENPWTDNDDILKSGALIVGDSPEDVETRTRELVVLLPKEYVIKPVRYSFEIKNVLGRTKKFVFYYAIIPPNCE